MLAFTCFRLIPIVRYKLVNCRCISSTRAKINYRLQRVYATTARKWIADPEPSNDSGQTQPLNLRGSTKFHASDGLSPSEWTLIYHNREHDRFRNLIPPSIIVGCFCLAFLTIVISLVIQDRDQLAYQKGDWLFLGWPLGVGLVIFVLTKYRRRFVLRIYERRGESSRRYCIVWLNWLLGRRKFIYDHRETSEAVERHPALASLWGNFKAKGRAWHVKANNFERAQDYFKVRVPFEMPVEK